MGFAFSARGVIAVCLAADEVVEEKVLLEERS